MEKNKGTIVKGVRLEIEVWKDLAKLAIQDKRNLNNYIANIINEHLAVKNKKQKS